jgi:hypothetical protein
VTTSRILLASALGIGCLAASGVGGYLAVKSGGLDAASTSAVEPLRADSPEAAPSPLPVERTLEGAPAGPELAVPATRPAPSIPAATRAATAPRSRVPSRAPEPRPAAPAGDASAEAFETTRELPTTRADAPVLPTVPVAALPEVAPPATETLVVERDAVIGIRMETAVSSETAKIEDRVVARVTRDVRVDGVTAIPAGARLEGTVTLVEPGGKFKDRARIGVRFTSVVLDDAARIGIETETIFRDGDGPTGEATSKIGASAVVGTILGAVIGGKKGAAIGGTAGAAGGTAAVMAGGRNAAVIADGTALTVRLSEPLSVTITPEP